MVSPEKGCAVLRIQLGTMPPPRPLEIFQRPSSLVGGTLLVVLGKCSVPPEHSHRQSPKQSVDTPSTHRMMVKVTWVSRPPGWDSGSICPPSEGSSSASRALHKRLSRVFLGHRRACSIEMLLKTTSPVCRCEYFRSLICHVC